MDTYILKLPTITITMLVEEKPDAIKVAFKYDGKGTAEDADKMRKWGGELLHKYDSDPRPVSLQFPDGDTLDIYGNADECFGILHKGK